MPQGIPLPSQDGVVLNYNGSYNAFVPSTRLSTGGITGGLLTLSATFTAPRTWTVPDRDDTFAGLGAQAFTGRQTFPDGALGTPSINHAGDTTSGRSFISSALTDQIAGQYAWVTGASTSARYAWGAVPRFTGQRANGTQASPTAIALNDVLVEWGSTPYEATTPGFASFKAAMQAVAMETGGYTATALGFKLRFNTVQVGATASQTRYNISSEGALCFGDNAALTAYNGGTVIPAIQLHSTGSNGHTIGMARFANDAGAVTYYGAKSRSGSTNSFTTGTTQAGDTLVSINGQGVDSTPSAFFREAGRFVIEQDAASGAAAVPGRARVYTTNSGGTSTLALTIDSAQSAQFAGTTDASAVGTAAATLAGGLGVAKRSFLGTIGSTFAGNVIAGVQNATAAVSGQQGEIIESKISTATNAAATGTFLALTSITLTPGDWDIAGLAVEVVGTGATTTAGGALEACIGTTTASSAGCTSGYDYVQQAHTLASNDANSLTIPAKRVNISSSTTYYLNVKQTYSAGTPQWRGSITARRAR